MKSIFILLLLISTALGSAQEPPALNPPRFDVGTIDAGFYINNCLGFSYPIPEGWEINTQALSTAPGAAKHEAGGGLILLIVDQHTKRPFFNRMVLSATDASAMKVDTSEFVSRFVHAQAKDQPGHKLLREAYALEFAQKPFFRSDFTDEHSEAVLYKTFLSTKFRGYFLGWTIVAGSPDELDKTAQSLQKIVFQQDQPDPACVMGKEETLPELISGIIGSRPASARVATPDKVRVSQGVAQRLLIHKVQPVYPGVARANGIQGVVLLRAEIDTEGNIQDLQVVSGDIALTPAAIDAVKQWKYKPFTLNGKAVKVETQVSVIFTLQRQ